MRSFTKFAAVLALLAACGEGPLDPGAFTMEGTWQGRAFPYELSLELEQDGENKVSGSGEVRGLRERLETTPDPEDPSRLDTTLIDTIIADRLAVDVDGTWDYPDVILRLRAADHDDAVYDAQFGTSPDTVAGTITGSGFENNTIRIIRQPDGE